MVVRWNPRAARGVRGQQEARTSLFWRASERAQRVSGSVSVCVCVCLCVCVCVCARARVRGEATVRLTLEGNPLLPVTSSARGPRLMTQSGGGRRHTPTPRPSFGNAPHCRWVSVPAWWSGVAFRAGGAPPTPRAESVRNNCRAGATKSWGHVAGPPQALLA